MRIKQQYKKYSKNFSPLVCVPKEKILKFHRPKWKKIQKLILKDKLKKKKQKLKFKHYGKVFCIGSRWDRVSSFYRNQLLFKKTIQTLFLNSVSNQHLKKIYLNKKSKFFYLQSLLYQFEYRIDILLSRLKFFSTSFLVKNNIQKGQVLVNNKNIKTLMQLSKGDIILVLNLEKIIFTKKTQEPLLLHTFIEVDYYTNQIIIIKNLQELTEKDFFLLSRELYNILDLRDHLLR